MHEEIRSWVTQLRAALNKMKLRSAACERSVWNASFLTCVKCWNRLTQNCVAKPRWRSSMFRRSVNWTCFCNCSTTRKFLSDGMPADCCTTSLIHALEPLVRLMKTDPDPQVRNTAAYALGGIGDIRAIPALIETLDNDHEFDEMGHSASSCAARRSTYCQDQPHQAQADRRSLHPAAKDS